MVDLGSGGGLPGLPLLIARPDVRWVFIEAGERRSQWLQEAIELVGAETRAEVRPERAELSGRGDLREEVDAVVARSFGPPGVLAECAAPLLRVGGWLWAAEPPEPLADRWPVPGLAELGFGETTERVPSWKGLRKDSATPDRYPRRVGIPMKRPIF